MEFHMSLSLGFCRAFFFYLVRVELSCVSYLMGIFSVSSILPVFSGHAKQQI